MKKLFFLAIFLSAGFVFAANNIFPNKIVQFAWFYKPPKDGNLDVVAKKYDWFILTMNDEPVRDRLKTMGAQGPFLEYLRFDAIEDPGSCEVRPHQNQVANEPGDFCSITKNHPDWLLRDLNGQPIQSERYVLMDPGNTEWQQFWLQRAKQFQEKNGWDGVFLDNVEGTLAKRAQKGFPSKYSNDEAYTAAIQGFLSFIYKGYFAPQKRPLLANIISAKDKKVVLGYLNVLDGAMVECFAADWHDGYRNPEEWEDQLSLIEKAQQQGKLMLLVGQGQSGDQNRQQFAYASYLLVTQGHAAFRYTLSKRYVETWLYPNYETDLGRPLGTRYKKGDVWQRDFEKGSVKVDPEKHTAQISTK